MAWEKFLLLAQGQLASDDGQLKTEDREARRRASPKRGESTMLASLVSL